VNQQYHENGITNLPSGVKEQVKLFFKYEVLSSRTVSVSRLTIRAVPAVSPLDIGEGTVLISGQGNAVSQRTVRSSGCVVSAFPTSAIREDPVTDPAGDPRAGDGMERS
jgi:hypothetical protein